MHNWAKAHAEHGAVALKDAQRGRPEGSGRALTPAQEERIKKELVDRTPDQLKLKFALWSAQSVRAAIRQMFLVDLPVRTVRKYLARCGFTPQRPVKRAYEQRPEAVEKWLKEEYPTIVARAKAEGAEISWADETAASSVEHYARGYAPRDKTPVLVLSQSKPLPDQPHFRRNQPRHVAIHALPGDAGREHVHQVSQTVAQRRREESLSDRR